MRENPRLRTVRLSILEDEAAFLRWHKRAGNPGGWGRGLLVWCREGMIRALTGKGIPAHLASSSTLVGAYELGFELALELDAATGDEAHELARIASRLAAGFDWPRLDSLELEAVAWQWFVGMRDELVSTGIKYPRGKRVPADSRGIRLGSNPGD